MLLEITGEEVVNLKVPVSYSDVISMLDLHFNAGEIFLNGYILGLEMKGSFLPKAELLQWGYSWEQIFVLYREELSYRIPRRQKLM
jgi:hypothetical protein